MTSRARRDKKRDNRRKASNATYRGDIRAKILARLTSSKDLTEDEAKLLLSMKIEDTKMTVDNIEKSAKIFLNAVNGIAGEFNCLQIQRVGIDLESIIAHIEDLNVNGPKAAHRDVPLSESEISDEAPENISPMGIERE